jgi:hypothetical protein
MLNVAIAVETTTSYGSDAVLVVAGACDEVLGEGRCPVASALKSGTVTAWYALVHPNDPGLSSARIEFRDRTADGVLIEERLLEFPPNEPLSSRLASLGSVIAALAAAREGSLVPRPRERLALPPASLVPPIAPQKTALFDWSFDLAALVAPPVGGAPDRVGGLARVRMGFAGRLFTFVSARYAAHAGDPSFSWWSGSAGVGMQLWKRTSYWNVELTSEFVVEHTSVAAESGAAQDSAGVTGLGGGIGADLVWQATRPFSLLFGIDATAVLPRLNVYVGQEDAGQVPALALTLSLGVRFHP